jgi:predicted membrane channel-forming protein YqfA (hemolysin III family)
MNFLLAMFSYYVTSSSLQTVYKEDIEKKENISGLFLFSQLLELEVINTYIFRTSVGIVYASGSLIAWLIGYALTGNANSHLMPIIGMYICFGSVIFCLLDFPEAFFTKGTFDIVGASHQLFHVGIICGFLFLWTFFYKVSLLVS